ncbi:MAG: bifunctional 2',3'-cyclic-nucleotide 2'-phosphodiesterase/3'-nucleotidase [Dokdonella sp.]|uniref:bifunctional 2',3'-cyclic-nucleotide 2'-phosphodiesterase/3'-nucleotidase n=1 Tax=Dokdonella sp. TaxID=2291710 RepID=UPI0025BB129B|nr:bifunctional 2',3'-cyclic-nucleotide 2'-phosphodiesterase/3'-nucleotidase [Dokdonella sp.]MBZ0222589.1 bifunctional 2',3'-cyclic-nucleotide 2'-phosphodiesterase/3'-nucleotidase [Dokdonella sp.]
MIHRKLLPALLVAFTTLLAACAHDPQRTAHLPDGTRAQLAILESTDLHSNIRSYDYYQDTDDPGLGFERMATLVKQARAEFPNTLLFDAGDTIQGTALADYQALVKPLGCDEELAMYRAMDALGYDGGTIGNHEFNYGLPFLAQVSGATMDVDGVAARHCAGPHFPRVLANVFSARDQQPIFPPYAVLERTLDVELDGKKIKAPIRIGIIGFTPPSIMAWDQRNLEGKVFVKGLVEAAREYLPKLRAQGVDLVVAISHGGIDRSQYTPTMENANLYLAAEPGIDVLLLGHSHTVFPEGKRAGKRRFAGIPGVDDERGFIHGKPAVMGNFWGKSLGVIELALVHEDGHWKIDPDTTKVEVRDIKQADGSFVAADAEIAKLVEPVHEATRRYVATPIGDSDFPMTTYFADVGDVSALQPVNSAQADYARHYIDRNLPQYKGLPVLSAMAPLKGGFGGPSDYTDVPAGPLAIRNAADLYLYPNTLTAVKIDGALLKAWLEHSAERFNRIDPERSEAQDLVNRRFSVYNFDVIQNGLSYAIDVTREAGSRIVDLRYQGTPVAPTQDFIVVTNNYRASGGGGFPGLDGNNIVLSAPDGNRDVLIDWVREHRHLTRADDGADRNWHFVPVKTKGTVRFVSASGKLELAKAAGLAHIRLLKDHGDGTSTYAIDLYTTSP